MKQTANHKTAQAGNKCLKLLGWSSSEISNYFLIFSCRLRVELNYKFSSKQPRLAYTIPAPMLRRPCLAILPLLGVVFHYFIFLLLANNPLYSPWSSLFMLSDEVLQVYPMHDSTAKGNGQHHPIVWCAIHSRCVVSHTHTIEMRTRGENILLALALHHPLLGWLAGWLAEKLFGELLTNGRPPKSNMQEKSERGRVDRGNGKTFPLFR